MVTCSGFWQRVTSITKPPSSGLVANCRFLIDAKPFGRPDRKIVKQMSGIGWAKNQGQNFRFLVKIVVQKMTRIKKDKGPNMFLLRVLQESEVRLSPACLWMVGQNILEKITIILRVVRNRDCYPKSMNIEAGELLLSGGGDGQWSYP